MRGFPSSWDSRFPRTGAHASPLDRCAWCVSDRDGRRQGERKSSTEKRTGPGMGRQRYRAGTAFCQAPPRVRTARWAQKRLWANRKWQERRGGSRRSLLQARASQVAFPVLEPGVPVGLVSALAPGRVTRPCHPGRCRTAAPYPRPGSSSCQRGRPHAAPRPPSLMAVSP